MHGGMAAGVAGRKGQRDEEKRTSRPVGHVLCSNLTNNLGWRHEYVPPVAPSRTRRAWPLASLDHLSVRLSYVSLSPFA